MVALSFLKGLGYNVKVITDKDIDILTLADVLGCKVISLNDIGEYDLFLCVHGRKIIPKEMLNDKMINIHPTDYNGHNPVKKYIDNMDSISCLRAMYMTDVVDEGREITRVTFKTGIVMTYADYYNIAIKEYVFLIDKVLKMVL